MDSRTATDQLSLRDLVDPQRWQRLQDHFSSVLGVPIRTVSLSRELLVSPSWPTSLSAERVVSLLKVGDELEPLIPIQEPLRDAATLTTAMGITYAAVPIFATSDHVVAYFVLGPMVVGRREEESQFRQRISAMGQDPQPAWILLLSLKLYTFAGIRSVLALMQEVGGSIVQFAYQAKQLNAILPTVSRVDHVVAVYYTDRVLRSLLEAATLATRAEGGSILVYEARTDAFKLQTAQGLSEAVMAATHLKRGEGLAGLAALERSILIVDADTGDARLRERMHRQELASSLIAPLALDADREPLGVLSLRTTNAQRRFTQDHVELVRRLLDLTAVALKSLQLVSVL